MSRDASDKRVVKVPFDMGQLEVIEYADRCRVEVGNDTLTGHHV